MNKEKIVKFYQKYRMYLFPAIVALSSLILIIGVIYPQTVKLIVNQKAQEDLLNKSSLLDNKVSALEGYNGQDLPQKVEIALQALPADKDFGRILGILDQLAIRSGFSISSISLGNAAGKVGNTDSYQVKIELKGAKVLLPVFLSSLENSARLIRISSIDSSINAANQSVDLTLVVDALYAGLPQKIGAPDTPLPELNQQDEQTIAVLSESKELIATSAATLTRRGKPNPFE